MTATADPKLLTGIAAAGDAVSRLETPFRQIFPGSNQIRDAAERFAPGYMQALAAAPETDDPAEPFNSERAMRTGTYLPHAFDPLYHASKPPNTWTNMREMSHADTRFG